VNQVKVIKRTLVPRTVAAALIFAMIVLVVLHAGAFLFSLSFAGEGEWLYKFEKLFSRLFRLDREMNLPTLFSTMLLLGAAFLLFCLGSRQSASPPEERRYWLGLGAVFVFLAVDEFVKIHEIFINPVRIALDTEGALRIAWVIPYGIATVVLGLFYARFWWGLPPRARWLFLLAAGLYVGGAVGFEMVGSAYIDSQGYPYGSDDVYRDRVYFALISVEEIGEMLGMIVFIYILLELAGKRVEALQLSVTRGGSALNGRH
jgi:hypothetical protein